MGRCALFVLGGVRLLRDKPEAEIIAFYRAAGEAAMEDLKQRSKPRKRKAG